MRFFIGVAWAVAALVMWSGGLAAQGAGPGSGASKTWLGLEATGELADLTKAEADALGMENPHGARVLRASPGSPAEQGGLLAGDVIVLVDGQDVADANDFLASVATKAPGTALKLRVLRGGKEKTLTLTLGVSTAGTRKAAARDPALLPMLDTGGHRAEINGLAFTPDGKHLISAASDKVIRVWDWRTGKTVGTLHGEVGAGSVGMIFTLALSPDGTTLAVGGWMPQDIGAIRVYDLGTGLLKGLLAGHENIVIGLAFSMDGRRLISGSADKTAIIWDVAQMRPLHRLAEHADQIYAVGFTPDGERAVTGSYDTTLRLWSVSRGDVITVMNGHNDKVFALAVSPVDGRIASGSQDGEIRLWDGATGRPVASGPPNRREEGVLTDHAHEACALRFSPDGKWLLSGNVARAAPFSAHVWEVATGRELVTYTQHDNIVAAAAISPHGRLAATGGGSNNEIHIWDLATGERIKGLDGQPVTLGGTGASRWAVGLSADGQHMAWGNRDGRSKENRPLESQLRLPHLGKALGQPEPVASTSSAGPSRGDSAAWLRALVTRGGVSLTERRGGEFGWEDAVLDIRRDGKTLASIELSATDGMQHRAYTLTPDGAGLISGGNEGMLMAYDLNGWGMGRFVGHEGDVLAVAISPDGKYLLSGSSDQTIRLWNLKTRELIITLFHGRDGQWVMYTPQGYYAGSPGADNLIGWQINKGPDKAAEFVAAAQLRAQFFRPDIVGKAILLASAEAAVAQSTGTSFRLADLLARPVPSLRITAPVEHATVSGGAVTMRVTFTKTPDPIKSYTVRVNGTSITSAAIDEATASTGVLALPVPLFRGENKIVVVASNAVGESTEQAGTLMLTHTGEGALDKRGTLYVLAIGVDQYPRLGLTCGKDHDRSCDLSYGGADATAFADMMVKTLGLQHQGTPNVQLLVNAAGQKQPTAANIQSALSAIRNRAQPNDTVVVFVAGHGVLDGPDYVFLSTDAVRDGGGFDGATIVKWVELESAVFGARGRRYLFVDTCHSAGAYNGKLGNSAYHNDVVAYTATGQDQDALEFAQIKHGVFTYALMAGLEHGEADTDNTKIITVDKLGAYLKSKAHELITKHGKDTAPPWPIPELHKARDAGNHVIARVR